MKNSIRHYWLLLAIFINPNISFSQWIHVSTNTYVTAFAVSGTNLFAGTYGDGVFLSTNNGTSWINDGLTNVFAFAVIDTKLFAATGGGGVFLSTNNGTSWNAVNNGIPNGYGVQSFAVSGSNFFAAGSGVFLSTNNGTSWTKVGTINATVYALAVSGTNLFAGTNNGGVFLSTNNGTSWTAVNTGLNNLTVRVLANSSTYIFAGTDGGVYRSSNNGTSWTAVNNGFRLELLPVTAFAVSGTNLFAGTCGGDAVFLSTNNGTSWNWESQGLTYNGVMSLVVSGTNLFAGTDLFGVWRRPLLEMTSVERFSTDLPTHFSLDQNYPNPFNPTTTISFNLPSKSFVSLKVFDIMGREIATIVSEEMSAGSYSRQWNAANMSSGIYFYRLQACSFTETKKLILLR